MKSLSVGRPPRPPQPQQERVSLGGQSLNSSGQHRGHDVGRDNGKGLLGHGDASTQPGKTSFLPPKKRAEFKSPELHNYHGNGSDENSSKPAAEKPLGPEEVKSNPTPASSTTIASEEVKSNPTPASSTTIALGSPTAVPGPPPFGSSDVDVRMMQRNEDQDDVLGLGGYIEKKRLLSKASFVDAEEEVKVSRKKTRLGFGQGLAKYEQQKKEQNGQKLVSEQPCLPPGKQI